MNKWKKIKTKTKIKSNKENKNYTKLYRLEMD